MVQFHWLGHHGIYLLHILNLRSLLSVKSRQDSQLVWLFTILFLRLTLKTMSNLHTSQSPFKRYSHARLFLVSGNVMKHRLLCLIYYLLAPHAINLSLRRLTFTGLICKEKKNCLLHSLRPVG